MRQTEHYGLNLWDLSDRIQMEDFNGGNRKLDAALAALAQGLGRVSLLKDWEENPGSYHSLGEPLSDIDWDEWSIILFSGRGKLQDANGGRMYSTLTMQTPTTPFIADIPSTRADVSEDGFLYALFPMQDKTRPITGVLLSENMVHIIRSEIAYEKIAIFTVGFYTPATGAGRNGYVKERSMIGIR